MAYRQCFKTGKRIALMVSNSSFGVILSARERREWSRRGGRGRRRGGSGGGEEGGEEGEEGVEEERRE